MVAQAKIYMMTVDKFVFCRKAFEIYLFVKPLSRFF